MKRIWIIGLAVVALAPRPASANGHWAAVAEEVCTEISRAESSALAGKPDDAKTQVINAYFAIFEEKKMEIAERANLGTRHTADIEDLFNGLRKAVAKSGAPDVAAKAETLRKALRTDAKELDAAKVGVDGVEGGY
jgi:hypothetical protein